jgi:hypothetical protein
VRSPASASGPCGSAMSRIEIGTPWLGSSSTITSSFACAVPVRNRHAASRPDRKAFGSATLATKAVASAGPTPGMSSDAVFLGRLRDGQPLGEDKIAESNIAQRAEPPASKSLTDFRSLSHQPPQIARRHAYALTGQVHTLAHTFAQARRNALR